MSENRKLHVAIIGAGRIGQRHAQHASCLARVRAICDIDEEVGPAIADRYRSSFYSTLSELIKAENEIDVAAVCTPNGLHAEHAIEALHAGMHVLCEKPMAISVRDCERMIAEAERCNRRLFVVKQNRFNPPVIAVKEAIDSGKLGRILSIQLNCFWNRNKDYYAGSSWKGSSIMDGGTLFTQFSHFIDLVFWLFGDFVRIQGMAGNLAHQNIIDFEDTGVVTFELENGALGTLHYTVNSFGKNMEGSLTIFGERGTVKIGGQYLNVLEYQATADNVIQVDGEASPPNDYGQYQGSMSNHDKVYENLVDVLTNGGTISTNNLEGLKTVQIIERIYRQHQAEGRCLGISHSS